MGEFELTKWLEMFKEQLPGFVFLSLMQEHDLVPVCKVNHPETDRQFYVVFNKDFEKFKRGLLSGFIDSVQCSINVKKSEISYLQSILNQYKKLG